MIPCCFRLLKLEHHLPRRLIQMNVRISQFLQQCIGPGHWTTQMLDGDASILVLITSPYQSNTLVHAHQDTQAGTWIGATNAVIYFLFKSGKKCDEFICLRAYKLLWIVFVSSQTRIRFNNPVSSTTACLEDLHMHCLSISQSKSWSCIDNQSCDLF